MKRRDFFALVGGAAAAWPLAARAQRAASPIVGFMSGRSSEDSGHLVAAFRQGLSESGFVEGKNLTIEYRWAAGRYDQLDTFAIEFVSRKVDVIVAGGATDAARAAQTATSTIPIIFINGSDAVADGLVTSLARPSGNLTGVTFLAQELNRKLFQLLREVVPEARRIAVLLNPTNSTSERQMLDLQDAARSSGGVELYTLEASNESEIDDVFGSLVRRRASGLVVVPEPFFASRRNQIVELAARHAIPAAYGLRDFALAGGLISYGASFSASFRQAGIYVGRILKGAKPGDLPVMQPTTFELVLNLKAARDLGLAVPASILARADEVIE